MIGIVRHPDGRFGNQIYHYNFIRQIAKKLSLGYFHYYLDISKYYSIEKRKNNFKKLFHKNVYINKNDLSGMSYDKVLDLFTELHTENKNIVINPPILGDFFFDYLFYDPNIFFNIKKQYIVNSNTAKNSMQIGIHYRGTDFKEWDSSAILDLDYYIKSIECCLNNCNKNNVIFELFTDDLSLNSLKKTEKYLLDNNLKYCYGNIKQPFIFDFYRMTQCDILISSPSTFSIWAGVLGKNKKCIHSKRWVNQQSEKNDKFWIDIQKNNSRYYNLWQVI